MAQEPQIPSRQLRLNVKVGSISFLILIKGQGSLTTIIQINCISLKEWFRRRFLRVPQCQEIKETVNNVFSYETIN